MAFLTTPKHGWALFTGGVLVLYVAAQLFSRHQYRCRCGATFQNADDFDTHLHTAHHYE
jgi:hypothetical protein